MSETTTPERKQISVTEVRNLLANGYTRTPKHKGYESTIGSISEHYNLTEAQIRLLFSKSILAGARTKRVVVPVFDLIDDTETVTVTDDTPVEAVATPVPSTVTPVFDETAIAARREELEAEAHAAHVAAENTTDNNDGPDLPWQ